MPRFPFDESQIEAIATFVLGLVAEPPGGQYLYRPDGPAADRIEGERLLHKYNCGGCHILEMPEIEYGTDPEDVFATEIQPADHDEATKLLLKMRPPRQGLTGEERPFVIDEEQVSLPVVRFRGLRFTWPDPEEDPVDQIHTFDLWETLHIGDKLLLPGERMVVPVQSFAGYKPARGGAFAEWLVETMMERKSQGNRFLAWQMAPPPLYHEGQKVQTPWLYRFLLEPGRLRHSTVLRMPQFNMSSEEAQSLANYFAAVDGVPYPYQDITPRDPDYVAAREEEYHDLLRGEGYLSTAWKALNGPLCQKCHVIAGRRPPPVQDPQKDIRGPDLDLAAERIRPDWAELWISKPTWILPYTSMPVNYPANKPPFELFGSNARAQVIGTRDAVVNYHRLLETLGRVEYKPATTPDVAASGGRR